MAEHKYDSEGKDSSRCLLIVNKSEKDWSYQHKELVAVKQGDIFAYEGYVKILGNSSASLSVILYDKEKQVIRWHYATKSISDAKDWVRVSNKFLVRDGVVFIRFRLTGYGKGKAWFDNIIFRRDGELSLEQGLNSLYVLENNLLTYKLNLQDKIIIVVDKSVNKEWQDTNSLKALLVAGIQPVSTNKLKLHIINPEFFEEYYVIVTILPGSPEVEYEIVKDAGAEFQGVEFPQVFNWNEGSHLVVPIQEGMFIYKDFPINEFPYTLRYGGSWPMAFIGMTDGEKGWMEILETPNDFEISRTVDSTGKLGIKNRWISQKGKFGYSRRIKYYFFDKGGYVAMAKRYREYVKEKGLLLTLREKEQARKGNLQKLIGAVDLWYWGKDKDSFVKELYNPGMKKVLFSNTDIWSIKTVNEQGFLSSVYDIYQDVWPPIYQELQGRHEGWPEDLVLDENGQWIKGWTIKKGFKEYPGGVICSIRGLARAKKQIPEGLKRSPYLARFIDTTTASPWRECYNPKHPMTRSEDIQFKMKLLGFVSNDLGLVTGSEDGVDVAVPFVDYFEGMMSPHIGRLPGSGRNVGLVTYMPPTEDFLKYQVGTEYRIPLWELVFHDSVVTTWYWDDSNNRIPEVWWRKDLFNILYGNMPLWAIRDWDHWKQYKERFIESYNNVSPVFEKVGFREMLFHKFISDDQKVQETDFKGDIRIVVNFGEQSYALKNPEYDLPAKGFVVFEKNKIWKKGICN